jgi:hypothetical protein
MSWDVENLDGAAPSIADLSSRHMSIAGGTNESALTVRTTAAYAS